MDKAIQKLKENVDSLEVDLLCKILDEVARESATAPNTQNVAIDFELKTILKNNKSIEILERIGDLCHLIRDPRTFQDELEDYFNVKALLLPTLMLMFQFYTAFKYQPDSFYVRLYDTINVDNIQSEGYLLFLLKCLDKQNLEQDVIDSCLRMLSKLSIEVNSDSCIKIIYCILVIMRMHPAAFELAEELKELNMLMYSFDSIKNIVQRIFIEAKYPLKRPKMVFLQNFVFPALNK